MENDIKDIIVTLHNNAISTLKNKSEEYFGGDLFSSIISDHIEALFEEIGEIKISIQEELPQLEEEYFVFPMLSNFLLIFTALHYYSLSLLPKGVQKITDDLILQSVTFVYIDAFVDSLYDVSNIKLNADALSEISMVFIDKSDDEKLRILKSIFQSCNFPIEMVTLLSFEFERAWRIWLRDVFYKR